MLSEKDMNELWADFLGEQVSVGMAAFQDTRTRVEELVNELAKVQGEAARIPPTLFLASGDMPSFARSLKAVNQEWLELSFKTWNIWTVFVLGAANVPQHARRR